MKIRVGNKAFRDAVDLVSCVGSRPNVEFDPANYILLEARESLKLKSTNSDHSIEVEIPAEVIDPGKGMLFKKRVSSVLAAMAPYDSSLLIETDKFIGGDGVRIHYGNDEFMTIPSPHSRVEDYPFQDDPQVEVEVEMRLNTLAGITKQVEFSAGSDQMIGLFCFGNVLVSLYPDEKTKKAETTRAFATDSYRTAIATSDLAEAGTLEKRLDILFPLRSLRLLRALWGKTEKRVKLQLGAGKVVCCIDNVRQIFSEGRDFPPVHHLLQETNWTASLRINREKLLAAIQRVMAVQLTGDQEQIAFIFRAKGEKTEIRVAGYGADGSIGCTKEEVDQAWKSEPFQIVFNPRFIASSLSNISDEVVTWKFSGERSRSAFEVTNLQHIIMPIVPDVLTVLNEAIERAKVAKLEASEVKDA